jgi:histidinol-phosphatase
MGPKKENLEHYINIALTAAAASDEILMTHWQKCHDRKRQGIAYTSKEDLSPVTQIDLEVEKIIRKILAENCPGHQIVGEEFGKDDGQYNTSPYTWIIDPIDGTKNYIRGLKYFTTQIALMYEGEIVVGISRAPALNETLSAFKNGGTFLNKEKIRVSKIDNLQSAFIIHGSIGYFYRIKKLPQFIRLIEHSWEAKGFGDCWSYHLLACGGIDAMLEAQTKIWDIAAVSLIVKEAGGRVTDLTGNQISFDSSSIIATNGLIHDEILTILHSGEE